MSGRIYDYGINPKCSKCGSDMYTSAQRNFNGPMCKKKGCNGSAIYEPFSSITFDKQVFKEKRLRFIKVLFDENYDDDGPYILEGIFHR